MWENEGSNLGLDQNFTSRAGEFNLLNIKLLSNLLLSLPITWKLDEKFCPTVREIVFQEDQIPSYSPTFPAWR